MPEANVHSPQGGILPYPLQTFISIIGINAPQLGSGQQHWHCPRLQGERLAGGYKGSCGGGSPSASLCHATGF